MSNKNMLEQILCNTEVVKEVVLTGENEKQQKLDAQKEKRKEQLRESQKNFKQIKANVKPELYDKIKNRSADGNVSGYLLKLIENDLSNTASLFESPLEIPRGSLDEDEELKSLRSEIEELKGMSFVKKLHWLFF